MWVAVASPHLVEGMAVELTKGSQAQHTTFTTTSTAKAVTVQRPSGAVSISKTSL